MSLAMGLTPLANQRRPARIDLASGFSAVQKTASGQQTGWGRRRHRLLRVFHHAASAHATGKVPRRARKQTGEGRSLPLAGGPTLTSHLLSPPSAGEYTSIIPRFFPP